MNNEKALEWLTAGQTIINDIVLHKYRELGMSTAQFMVYLELKSYIDKGVYSPDISLIAEHLGSEPTQIYDIMHQMIQQKLMTHDTTTDSYGKQSDAYHFDNLVLRILALETTQQHEQQATENTNNREQVFNKIEVEFGRPLSPIELETVAKWIDEEEYSIELIILSLQEAVLNQVWSLKYMDRILSNWERQNVKTVQQVEQLQSKRSVNNNNFSQPQANTKSSKPKIPIYKIQDQ